MPESSILLKRVLDENDNPLRIELVVRNIEPNKTVGIFVDDKKLAEFITDKNGDITEKNIAIPQEFLSYFLNLGGFGQISNVFDKAGIIGKTSAGANTMDLRYV